jgi:hypothetical protein
VRDSHEHCVSGRIFARGFTPNIVRSRIACQSYFRRARERESTLSETPSRAKPWSLATAEPSERRSAISKAQWADPITGAKMRAALRSPASRAKVSQAIKARWADPAGREKMIAQLRASHADPVVRQKQASATKKRWAEPSMREKMISGMRGKPKRRGNTDADS